MNEQSEIRGDRESLEVQKKDVIGKTRDSNRYIKCFKIDEQQD